MKSCAEISESWLNKITRPLHDEIQIKGTTKWWAEAILKQTVIINCLQCSNTCTLTIKMQYHWEIKAFWHRKRHLLGAYLFSQTSIISNYSDVYVLLIPDFKPVVSFINDSAEPNCMPHRSSVSYVIYNVHKIVIITVCSTYSITFNSMFLACLSYTIPCCDEPQLDKIKTEVTLQQSLKTNGRHTGCPKTFGHWFQSIEDTPSKN